MGLLDWLWSWTGRGSLLNRVNECLLGTAQHPDGTPLTRFECANEAIRCLNDLARRDPLLLQDHNVRQAISDALLLRAEAFLSEEAIRPAVEGFLALPARWGEPTTNEPLLQGRLRLAAEDLQRSLEQAPNEYARSWLVVVHLLLGNLATARHHAERITSGYGRALALEDLEQVEGLFAELSRRIRAVEMRL